ncbi:Transcription elongation factor 1-like protein [Apiospora kogelbergensis]|uniref:Transcription elongation factor 1-like protein n=1 Tax=Apiospora kogelbergensis TaxID=1337665 RepID=UPI00312DF6D6
MANSFDSFAQGKRKKAAKKPTSKKNEPLATSFTCLFCNHEKSVAVVLNKKLGVGDLDCKVCGQRFQCGINYLSAPIDVYSEWVDAADAVAQEEGNSKSASLQRPGARQSTGGRYGDDEDERRYDGEDIVDDDDEY